MKSLLPSDAIMHSNPTPQTFKPVAVKTGRPLSGVMLSGLMTLFFLVGMATDGMATDYYSGGALVANSTGSWYTNTNSTGSNPASFATAGNIYHVQNGHTMTTSALWTVSGAGSSIRIESGGILIATFAVSATSPATMVVNGTYQHNFNGGIIPTATWASSSNCNITGSTSTQPTGTNQTFGNLTFNSALTTTISLPNTGALLSIAGNLNIQNTSSGSVKLNQASTTVAGDCNVSSAFSLGPTSSRTLNVTGNFNLTAGTFTMSESNGIAGILKVAGNFLNTGGTVNETATGNGTIEFNGSGAQTFTSGTITATNIINVKVNNSAGVVLGSALTTSGSLIMSTGTLDLAGFVPTVGDLQGSSDITNNSPTGVLITAGSNNASTSYSGSISENTGVVSFTKNGTGILTLSGNSSYSGLTTITGTNGRIKLGAPGTAPNGPLGTVASGTDIVSGASLDIGGITLGTDEPLTLRGTGGTATGALINSSGTAASYNGLITLGASSTILTNAGDLNVANAGTILGPALTLTLGGSGNGSISSIIGTTTGAITKSGTGTWTLSGSNTYTGTTTISAGTLKLGATGTAPNSPLGTIGGATSITAGATLDLNGFTLATAELLTIRGTGASGVGALTNSSATNVAYSGLITLGAASSILTNSGFINISNVGTITGSTFALTIGGSGNGSISSIIGNTSGGVVKTGIGTWTLSGANGCNSKCRS